MMTTLRSLTLSFPQGEEKKEPAVEKEEDHYHP
jgi:hypothetical protein